MIDQINQNLGMGFILIFRSIYEEKERNSYVQCKCYS